MADELKTDEERAEELKAWWRSNGTSVLAGIAIAIGGVFGWQQWQNYQQNESEAGSAQLQAAQASDANKVTALKAVTEEYSSTPYGALAALSVAAETSQTDADATIAALKQAMEAKDPNVADIARLRLARAYIAAGKLGEAETLLDTKMAVAYTSLVEELKGDLFVAKKDLENARIAYDKAILSAGTNSAEYLRMKRDNLGKGA
ncbi:YfgM family protein [Leucothrix mucor]|uniref:YfgM family protein n=1 Tax=Leucothrix mucor TaxID=45248 RepID=UPI0003B352F0|nr:tetratricopeptide repeat protein [Leucothrix mucor]